MQNTNAPQAADARWTRQVVSPDNVSDVQSRTNAGGAQGIALPPSGRPMPWDRPTTKPTGRPLGPERFAANGPAAVSEQPVSMRRIPSWVRVPKRRAPKPFIKLPTTKAAASNPIADAA